MLPLIASMFSDRGLRPILRTSSRIVLWRVPDKVNRELSPDDQFIEIAVARRLKLWVCPGRSLNRKRDGDRTQMPKVEIGRQARRAIALRMVSLSFVVFKHPSGKDLQSLEPGTGTTLPCLNRTHAAIELVPA